MKQPLDYRVWQQQHVAIPPRTLLVATKPGVFAHGRADPAAEMLAMAVHASEGRVVLSLSCGNGMVAAAAARSGAARVYLTDRHGLAIDAAQRTLEANARNGSLAPVELMLGHGTDGLPRDLVVDVATVRVVPERIAMRQLVHDAMRALRPGGRCYLAGANEEGAKSAAKLLERYCGAVRLDAQRDGHRLVSGVRPATLPDVLDDDVAPWLDATTFHHFAVEAGTVHFSAATRPGVFSWEHLDEATADLLTVLTTCRALDGNARVLDIGCGAGVLGTYAALRATSNDVTLVDEDSESVRCATETLRAANVTNARARISDIAGAVLDQTFDVVLANPPFHVGKDTNLELPRQFMRDAHTVLRPGGTLWLVANRTLPYESVMEAQFGNVHMVHDGRRFKVLTATRS